MLVQFIHFDDVLVCLNYMVVQLWLSDVYVCVWTSASAVGGGGTPHCLTIRTLSADSADSATHL